jgi:actin-related protein
VLALTVGSKVKSDYPEREGEECLSLEDAVIKSIVSVTAPEKQQRLFQAIFPVGGTAKLPGFGEMLEEKVFFKLESKDIETVEVLVDKNIDQSIVQWQGGTVLAQAPSTAGLPSHSDLRPVDCAE